MSSNIFQYEYCYYYCYDINCRDSMAQDMREDSEVVLQAVSQHGLALQFARGAEVVGKTWEKKHETLTRGW